MAVIPKKTISGFHLLKRLMKGMSVLEKVFLWQKISKLQDTLKFLQKQELELKMLFR